MPTRTAEPPTIASTPDFLSLAQLDELPALAPFVEVCNELGAQITDLDQRIRLATERYGALWKGFQGTTISGMGQQEDPAVTEARVVVKTLEAQRKRLATDAVAARADLQAATAELRATLLPAMAAQLAPPLSAVIEALEATQAIERLCGSVGGHAQGRELARLLLAYLQAARHMMY
jgi:hypothetical protein